MGEAIVYYPGVTDSTAPSATAVSSMMRDIGVSPRGVAMPPTAARSNIVLQTSKAARNSAFTSGRFPACEQWYLQEVGANHRDESEPIAMISTV